MNDRPRVPVLATRCLDITQRATHLAISAALAGAIAAVDSQYWQRCGPAINRRSCCCLERSSA
jgi:hypothetical protein